MAHGKEHLQFSQTPAPGSALLRHEGDCITFALRVSPSGQGKASLRTDLLNAGIRRNEIIAHVESAQPILHREWHDIPMPQTGEGLYELAVPLHEVGCFSAKALFLPSGQGDPVWPSGDNTSIKVEPADYVAGNAVYTAFVRQFHRDTRGGHPDPRDPVMDQFEADGFSVIPPSGTFRDLAAKLDHIMGTMGFRVIQLLPVFPCPTTYARMGRFGSPFAALDYMDVDPALAEFDRRTTPLDQFRELVDAVHARDGRLFMDIPINHTGWASWLQIHHPEWFVRERDSSFHSPGAWGVTWEDLSQLDYRHRPLWRYMADVFLFWCAQGVTGFRCDAGYMVPFAVWEYITAKVRNAYPRTIFLLEGLGGGIETTESLLAGAGLNWAYSELFQNHDRTQVEACLAHAIGTSSSKGIMVHYAETHDNSRLAAVSPTHARMRTSLAALCSQNGTYGITNGVEWFATEKVDVHGSPPLRWGEEPNQVAALARLNAILADHPAFHAGASIHRFDTECGGNAIALLRLDEQNRYPVLVLVNLDAERPATLQWPSSGFPGAPPRFDLLTGSVREPVGAGDNLEVTLGPGETLCLARDGNAPTVSARKTRNRRRARAKVAELLAATQDGPRPDDACLEAKAERLLRDPVDFAVERQPTGGYAPVVSWLWPRDLSRVVMVPPSHILHLAAPVPFAVTLMRGETAVCHERSLESDDGTHRVLFAPRPVREKPERATLKLRIFAEQGCRHAQAEILYLAGGAAANVGFTADRERIASENLQGLCTNGRGAMSLVHASWGELHSRYDAMLAANLDEKVPVDRRILLRRCRVWIVFRDYSHELGPDCTMDFSSPHDGNPQWHMRVPVGMGKTVSLEIALSLIPGQNTALLRFTRNASGNDTSLLKDAWPVRLIVRPDLEDRSFHDATKAFAGAETHWPEAVRVEERAFRFAPFETHALRVELSDGRFVPENEWTYAVYQAAEAERGLESHADLFSPGYFECSLAAGERVELRAEANPVGATEADLPRQKHDGTTAGLSAAIPLVMAANHAIRHFVVKRDDSLTVIAGYPWFLDWGRDTLICLRGMIAAGMLDESLDVLRQFARFEREGTLPNMIRGNDDSNRDTSDAPLWFFVACSDLLAAAGDNSALETDCGGRSLREVLASIARHYVRGTPNGIVMDPASGLVFSPSHFTWMDTNHPAGTPREGYPVEIQALWHHAVHMMCAIDPGGEWQVLAPRIAESVRELFLVPNRGWLADCLHAPGPGNAAAAQPDDALRPNQLLTVTLGALGDRAVASRMLRAAAELLVPGAIRSLADRPVEYPLAIHRDGTLLNDPLHPYWGRYEGAEDSRRKPAYHNGTAWTWLFPSYCEALLKIHGAAVVDTARAILSSSAGLMEAGCLGQVPEIIDGNAPHLQRGCGAQAWGVTELYRVLKIVERRQRGS